MCIGLCYIHTWLPQQTVCTGNPDVTAVSAVWHSMSACPGCHFHTDVGLQLNPLSPSPRTQPLLGAGTPLVYSGLSQAYRHRLFSCSPAQLDQCAADPDSIT